MERLDEIFMYPKSSHWSAPIGTPPRKHIHIHKKRKKEKEKRLAAVVFSGFDTATPNKTHKKAKQ